MRNESKKLTHILGMMVIILAFVSCGQKSSSTPNSEADGSFDQSPSVLLGAVTIEPSEQESIVMECTAIAESYAHLYKSALKEHATSFYATSTMILSEDDFNTIMEAFNMFPMRLLLQLRETSHSTIRGLNCSLGHKRPFESKAQEILQW